MEREQDNGELMKELEELRRVNRELVERDRKREKQHANKINELEEQMRQMTFQEKDMSLLELIRPWSGVEEEKPIEEFLQDIENVAACSNWTDTDKQLVCLLKLTGAAALCVNVHPELHLDGATFNDYKKILKERFKDIVSPEEHLLNLDSISQKRGEGVREFADRCRILGQKTLTHEGSIEEQAWERKHMLRIVLAAYIKGLGEEVGRQLSHNPPDNMDDAEQRASVIELAERRASLVSISSNGLFGATQRSNELSNNTGCYRCGRRGHWARDCGSFGNGTYGYGPDEHRKEGKSENPRHKRRNERFKEMVIPEQHLLALNSIFKGRGEGVREFAARCEILGERSLTHKGSVEQQAWERKYMLRIVLAAYIKGLGGEVKLHLLYKPPDNMDDAVRRAAMIEQVEGRITLNPARSSRVYGVTQFSNNTGCFRCGRRGHLARDCYDIFNIE